MIKSRRMRCSGHVSCMERRDAYGKPEGNIPLVKPRRKWEDNIKMDLRETELIWLRIGTSGGIL
jgi:hypothetical protein